jgi:hypothetical protein
MLMKLIPSSNKPFGLEIRTWKSIILVIPGNEQGGRRRRQQIKRERDVKKRQANGCTLPEQ